MKNKSSTVSLLFCSHQIKLPFPKILYSLSFLIFSSILCMIFYPFYSFLLLSLTFSLISLIFYRSFPWILKCGKFFHNMEIFPQCGKFSTMWKFFHNVENFPQLWKVFHNVERFPQLWKTVNFPSATALKNPDSKC